jgi:hypothetical protein
MSELEALRAALRQKEDEVQGLQADLDFAETLFAKLQARAEREDNGDLPVPRLELRWIGAQEEPDGDWEYNLVVNHFTGKVVFYPLGDTEITGRDEPFYPNGRIRLPLRDGAHIMHDSKELKLPAFAIRGSRVEALGDT